MRSPLYLVAGLTAAGATLCVGVGSAHAYPSTKHLVIGDKIGDITTPGNDKHVPARMQDLPDSTGLTVTVRGQRVVTVFTMAEVLPSGSDHVQMVTTKAHVRQSTIQLFAISNRAAILTVNGHRACSNLLSEDFDASTNRIRVSYPVSCLPSGSLMYGVQGESVAFYLNVKGSDGSVSSGEIGRDAVQRTMPPDVRIR